MNKFKLEDVNSFDAWNDFVSESPQGTIFSHTYYLELAVDKYKLFWVKKGSQIKAGIVLILNKKGNQVVLDDLVIHSGLMFAEDKIQKKSIYCRFLWQILNEIPQMILSESIQNKKQIDSSIYPERILINSERIFTHDDINIQRGALINAENGPVIIDRGAVIYGQTYLEGPLYIGKNTIIKPLTQIKNSIIGPMCIIGGELETVIIQGYTNKVHGGHLGDSFLGKWVNLGAGTQNSNLKNNYSSVKVEVNGQNFDTKSLKIGCFIGDHTKTAIGTLLNSGTVLGVGSMIASSGFPPKTILPFTWYINREIKKVILDKFFESTCNVMRRRNEVLSEVERDLLKELQDKY